MKIPDIRHAVISFICLVVLPANSTFGWYDETHLAVAKAAGHYKWYHAAGADMSRIKAGNIESYNHFFNNSQNVRITPELVLSQAQRYNSPGDKEGHLYGAIIGSLREYKAHHAKKAYAEYHLAFAAHYIADLSQPLHNITYDNFAKKYHHASDGIVNSDVLENFDRISMVMYPIELQPDNFEYSVAKEVARLANQAGMLGKTLRKENRNITKEEAYVQLGHSASLLKAVITYFDKQSK